MSSQNTAHTSTAHYISEALQKNFVCADAIFSLHKSAQQQKQRNHTIIIGKKILTKAVDRNRVRRCAQEILRKTPLPTTTHITLCYRAKKVLPTKNLSKSITTLLQKI